MKKIKAMEYAVMALSKRAEDSAVYIASKDDTNGLMAYRIKEAECNAYTRVLDLIKDLENKPEPPIGD